MNKNLKKLMAFWFISAWLVTSVSLAATQESCFKIADAEVAGWGIAIIEYTCFDNEVKIPDTIMGKKVTEIRKWVFKDAVIKSVKLPSTLKQIDESAFENNILEKLEIPEWVETIGDYAFRNNKLTALKIPASLKVIGNGTFQWNNLTKIAVPGRLNKVGDEAFCENGGKDVIGISETLEWNFKKSCFNLKKSSLIEDSYEWIDTDFEEADDIAEALNKLSEDTMDEVDDITDKSTIKEDEEIIDEDNITDESDEIEDATEINNEESDETDDSNVNESEINEESDDIVNGLWFSIWELWLDGLWSDFSSTDILWLLMWIGAWIIWIAVAIKYLMTVISALFNISLWELYRKAWKKGWAYLIPIYNTMVYAEIAEMNKWLWLIPWVSVIAPLALWVSWLVSLQYTGIVSLVLGLATLVLWIIFNYRVAKRFGWSTWASVLYVLFSPIAVFFLWLGSFKYQPTKKEYVLENQKEETKNTSSPEPVIAEEQLNNVVEHFVWPEETTTNQTTENKSESTVSTEQTSNLDELEKTTMEGINEEKPEEVKEEPKEQYVDYEEHIQTNEVDEPVATEEIPLAEEEKVEETTVEEDYNEEKENSSDEVEEEPIDETYEEYIPSKEELDSMDESTEEPEEITEEPAVEEVEEPIEQETEETVEEVSQEMPDEKKEYVEYSSYNEEPVDENQPVEQINDLDQLLAKNKND